MLKRNLRSFLSLGLLAVSFAGAQAQILQPPAYVRYNTTTGALIYSNYFADYVGGARFSINTPASVAGAKVFTISNDGSGGSGEWGGAITTPLMNVQVIKGVTDTLACTTLLNGTGTYPSLTGKVALVFRGTCQFADKALAAQTAGAIACIIVNNVPGGPVGMGAGTVSSQVSIPVLMVSQNDGLAIADELNNGATVTMSIARWGLGANNDLGIIPGGMALWHNYATPYSQLSASNGNPDDYKYHSGVFVGNFGSSTASNVKAVTNISFHPDAGGSTNLFSDSVTEASNFNPSDSIIALLAANNGHNLHATAKGRFDVDYTITSASADDVPEDNAGTTSFYTTDSIFSKGRYDFAAGKPITNISYGSTGGAICWGPLYFVATSGTGPNLYARKVQFTIAISGNGTLGGTPDINVILTRWNDLDTSGTISRDELSIVGLATKIFDVADTSFDIFTVDLLDSLGVNNPVKLEPGNHYWIGVDVPQGEFLGCDGLLNYYVRSYSVQHNDPNMIDAYAPFGGDVFSSIGATDVFAMYPFEGYNYPIDSVGFAHQKSGMVPAVPLHVSAFPNTVSVGGPSAPVAEVNLFPNPAASILTADIRFEQTVKKATYIVYNTMGQRMSTDQHANVKDERYAVPVKNLAAGTYYLVINGDGRSMFKKFSIVK